MTEQVPEAKDFESKAEEFLNEAGMENPEVSSPEVKPEGTETPTPDDPGAEPAKTEEVKAVEDDDSLTVEQKIEKVKEILGDDEKAINAYIKEKGYHNDPAWQKQRELIDRLKKEGEAKTTLSEEDKVALDEFKQFRSSPEYIQTSMKAQGYTQEAINKKLGESGFEVPSEPQDDVKLVLDKLNIDPNTLNADQKASIEDIVRVAEVLVNDKLGKVLPKELAPLKEGLGSITKSDSATKMIGSMEETVKAEGILDFKNDIEPALNKFIDDNPNALQKDVMEHFSKINHTLTVERLKTGKKKEERDEKKTHLRQNIPISGTPPGLPTKTGNFDKDADAFFDTVNM